MNKIIMVLLFLTIPILTAKSQNVYSGYYANGYSNSYINTDVDSNTTYTSDWFDATIYDAQTIYMTVYYLCATSQADTLQRIAIEGNFLVNNSTYASVLVDTLDVVSQAAGVNGAASGYTNLAYSRVPGTGVVQHITMTPSGFAPLWRIKVIGGANNGILVVSIYSRVNDYVPTAQNFGNVRP